MDGVKFDDKRTCEGVPGVIETTREWDYEWRSCKYCHKRTRTGVLVEKVTLKDKRWTTRTRFCAECGSGLEQSEQAQS